MQPAAWIAGLAIAPEREGAVAEPAEPKEHIHVPRMSWRIPTSALCDSAVTGIGGASGVGLFSPSGALLCSILKGPSLQNGAGKPLHPLLQVAASWCLCLMAEHEIESCQAATADAVATFVLALKLAKKLSHRKLCLAG